MRENARFPIETFSGEIREDNVVKILIDFGNFGNFGKAETTILIKIKYVELLERGVYFFRGSITVPYYLYYFGRKNIIEGFANLSNPAEVWGWISFKIHKAQNELNPSPRDSDFSFLFNDFSDTIFENGFNQNGIQRQKNSFARY